MVRRPKLLAGLSMLVLCGCELTAVPYGSAPLGQLQNTTADSVLTQTVKPLPFTGRLTQGDPDELPPIVAASLSPNSPVTFAYREQLTHDEYHVPLAISAFDPVTYIGAPLGDYGVTAFASLTISCGDAVVGDYQAKAFVTKSYSLYSEPTHREVENAARRAVRTKLDTELARDTPRLTHAACSSSAAASSTVVN
jgi:hypothetical protein